MRISGFADKLAPTSSPSQRDSHTADCQELFQTLEQMKYSSLPCPGSCFNTTVFPPPRPCVSVQEPRAAAAAAQGGSRLGECHIRPATLRIAECWPSRPSSPRYPLPCSQLLLLQVNPRFLPFLPSFPINKPSNFNAT